MSTKVYIAYNTFEQALVILNLFYFQMREEKCMFDWSGFAFFSNWKQNEF